MAHIDNGLKSQPRICIETEEAANVKATSIRRVLERLECSSLLGNR